MLLVLLKLFPGALLATCLSQPLRPASPEEASLILQQLIACLFRIQRLATRRLLVEFAQYAFHPA